MQFTGKSRVLGIIGDPVAHSLSPVMQNRALRQLGIDAVYVPFHVLPSSLPQALEGVRALQIDGINVTVPHKEAVLPLLDELDPHARLIGAVNTIVNRDGRLIGYNTDGLGFLAAAREELGFAPQGSRVVLLGAGGACRAAVVALASAGAQQICVANRTSQRAADLIAELRPHFPQTRFSATSYGTAEFLEQLESAGLVVNTTSVGLKGESLDFLPLENINSSALISDMVYSIVETPLLQTAKARGFRANDGLGMLAGQGAEAFFLWTGQRIEAGLMKEWLMEYRKNG